MKQCITLEKGQGVPGTHRGMPWRSLGFPTMTQDKGEDRTGPLFSSGDLMVSLVMTSGSHTVPRLPLKFQGSSCPCLPSAVITGVCHHIQLPLGF